MCECECVLARVNVDTSKWLSVGDQRASVWSLLFSCLLDLGIKTGCQAYMEVPLCANPSLLFGLVS